MDPEEFRRHGYAMVDWIADYWSSWRERPVTSPGSPGEVAARLPASPAGAGRAVRPRSSPTSTGWSPPA